MARRSEAACDGCFGKRRCGVCLGMGVYDVAKGVVATCERCSGTGRCWLCQNVSAADRLDGPAPGFELDDF